MNKAQYDTFVKDHEQGTLLKPSQPGNVMAKFVASPQKDLSGKSIKYVTTTPLRPLLTTLQVGLARPGSVS